MARKVRKFICEKCGSSSESKTKGIRFCSNSCRASIINKGRMPPNYDKNKIRNCKICGVKIHHQAKTGYCKEHYATESHKKMLSNKAKDSGNGGYKIGSGRGKNGWYKGYWCDSSWELAWVIFHLDHKIKFERNNESFEYVYLNKLQKYYPDFKIDECYIEIKGWMTAQVKAKIEQFPKEIKLLQKKDMNHIFEYVYGKYGKDFIKLYE